MQSRNITNLKTAVHLTGWACMLVATVWMAFCFLQINLYGYTKGVEPIFAVRVGELALYIYASCYAVYAFTSFMRGIRNKLCEMKT